MSNTIVWFTLSAEDPDALTSFYGDLLAWEVDEARLTSTDSGVSGKLRTIRTGGLPGSISTEDERGIVLVVEVDDLAATLGRARELGVTVTREGFEIEGLGDIDGRFRTAWMHDPEGNRLALVKRER